MLRKISGRLIKPFALGFAAYITFLSTMAMAGKRVGIATAVNPQALSITSNDRTRIVLGKNIVYKERIKTSDNGLVQILLVDGSTFTVGPNSDLMIDKFVYDPATKTGKLVATFSKGVLRFIGGRLSKRRGGVLVKTPLGSLAIRGGIFQTRIDGSNLNGLFAFLFGEEMILTIPDGRNWRVFERGYTIDISGGLTHGPKIRRTRADDTQIFMSSFVGNGRSNGGASRRPTSLQVQNSGLPSLNSALDPLQNSAISQFGTDPGLQTKSGDEIQEKAGIGSFVFPGNLGGGGSGGGSTGSPSLDND